MNALIIEDDANIALVMRTWLESCGYEVTITGSLKEAEDIIASVPKLEVITLDLNLTDSTREFTIPRIRGIRQQNKDALLVVISGVVTMEDEQVVTSLGADGIIEKIHIPTEKNFWTKLNDMVSALVRTPVKFQRNAALLEGIAQKIAKRCDTLKCNIAERITTKP